MTPNEIKLFNTPLEIGLRSLFILSNTKKTIDLQTLIYYDYLLLHSGDVNDGPLSIHPSTPLRSGEILVKRELMQKGLQMMHQKEIISIVLNESGIGYKANKLTKKFLSYQTSHYSKILNERAFWVNNRFKSFKPEKLKKFMESNLEKWSMEFTKKPKIENNEK